jgi:hypothetical protein
MTPAKVAPMPIPAFAPELRSELCNVDGSLVEIGDVDVEVNDEVEAEVVELDVKIAVELPKLVEDTERVADCGTPIVVKLTAGPSLNALGQQS